MVHEVVIANEVKQSMASGYLDYHGLRPRSDGGKRAMTLPA